MLPRRLAQVVITGFKRSFFPGSYLERRAYVRKAMDYYDMIAAQHTVKQQLG